MNHPANPARILAYDHIGIRVSDKSRAINFYQSMGLKLLVESRAPRPQAAGVPPEFRMGIVF